MSAELENAAKRKAAFRELCRDVRGNLGWRERFKIVECDIRCVTREHTVDAT